MSLNWNIREVRNWQKKQEKDGHTLECLIWASLTIGMGDLNEKTAKEFLYRLNRYSREVGAIATYRNGRTVIASEKRSWMFGLHTNVRTISNSAFDKLVRERSGR